MMAQCYEMQVAKTFGKLMPLIVANCNSKFETVDMPSCRNGTQWLTAGVEVMARSQWHGTPTMTDIYKKTMALLFIFAAAHAEQSRFLLSCF